MSESINGPFRIYKRRGSNATNDGSAQTNASGFSLGDNTGATTVSQEFWVYQPTAATTASLPLFEVGVGGTSFISGAISIPNVGQASAAVIATIPAGSRIQAVTCYVDQALTAGTDTLTVSLNGTAIGSFAIGTTIGAATFTPTTVLAGLRLLSYVGLTDAVLTISGTVAGATGGILAEISVNYTVKNADGSIIPYGSGLTNDGTGTTSYVGAALPPALEAAPEVVVPEVVAPQE